jgi:pimeloyl-ACP methyl ester carboxylesterase
MFAVILRWSSRLVLAVLVLAIIAVAGLFGANQMLRAQVASQRRIDAPPGIEWSGPVEINGIQQWITIRGRNINNPVLLFLHGGPGTPMTPFAHVFQNGWENELTVVQWDQRNAGKTFLNGDRDLLQRTTDMAHIGQDALAVIDYLRARLHKDKIAILGHSWGTMLGTPLAAHDPDRLCAYIGTGQVVNTVENERLGYDHTLAEAKKRNDAEAIRELGAVAPYPEADGSLPMPKMNVLRKWEGRYGYMLANSENGIMWPMLKFAFRSPEWSLLDIRFFLADLDAVNARLDGEINKFDARRLGTDFQVPMFFIMGENDWQTPTPLTRAYYEEINAPVKNFTVIGNAASHSAMVTEPDAFAAAVLRDVKQAGCK